MNPVNVDKLLCHRAELFPNPVPSLKDRLTISIGEYVKIAVGIREEEKLIKGRWLNVESRTETNNSVRFYGRSWPQYYDDELCFEFGPEHVFRMEPREFLLWGKGKIPQALRGNTYRETPPPFPVNHDGNQLDDCREIVLCFEALGCRAAREHYEQLASLNNNWPKLEDLK